MEFAQVSLCFLNSPHPRQSHSRTDLVVKETWWPHYSQVPIELQEPCHRYDNCPARRRRSISDDNNSRIINSYYSYDNGDDGENG